MWYNICGSVILLIDILVCDDSAEIVEQVKKLLCAWEKVNTVSFNIDCRQSGKFILENKHKYDIAFIDIEMPEMSGLELAVELKKQNPDVLIYRSDLVSAISRRRDAHPCFQISLEAC